MELLSKREIDTLKGVERKRDIDEGLKIARKVDVLRETLSEEQKQWDTFQQGTTKQIQKEIDTLIEKKGSLEKEIEVAVVELEHLRQPLDKEWEEVKTQQEKLTALQHELSITEKQLKKEEKTLEKREKEVIVAEKKASLNLTKSEETLLQAKEKDRQSESSLKKAKQIENDSLLASQTKSNELENKQKNLIAQERSLENRELLFKQKERNLLLKEKEINDKYKTLQRTINRVEHANTTRNSN